MGHLYHSFHSYDSDSYVRLLEGSIVIDSYCPFRRPFFSIHIVMEILCFQRDKLQKMVVFLWYIWYMGSKCTNLFFYLQPNEMGILTDIGLQD